MKLILSIFCLFILSCDSNNPSSILLTELDDFIYPLSIGNEWNYELTEIISIPTPNVGNNQSGETCDELYEYTSLYNISVKVIDIVTMSIPNINNNELLDLYKIEYTKSSNAGYNTTFIIYVNNTSEGYIMYALDNTGGIASEGFPKYQNNLSFDNDIFLFGFNNNRECFISLIPSLIKLKYPISLNNTWTVIDDTFGLINQNSYNCNTDNLNIIKRTVSNISDNECFDIYQERQMPELAIDLLFTSTYQYCKNIGLKNVIFYNDLGTQTELDSFGNISCTYNSYSSGTLELISFNIND